MNLGVKRNHKKSINVTVTQCRQILLIVCFNKEIVNVFPNSDWLKSLSDHLVLLQVSFERCGHFLIAWSHSQFCSRDVDTFWPPGLTPSFVREIWTLPDHLVSLPVSFERFGHFLITFTYKARTYNKVRETTQFVQMTLNFTFQRLHNIWLMFASFFNTHPGMRRMWYIHSDHLVSLPVLLEGCGHFPITWSQSQFRSRDWDPFWSPGHAPSFIRGF
jgi:hypothetical protein